MPFMGTFILFITSAMVIFLLFSFFLWAMGMRFREEQGSLLYFPNDPPNSRNMCASPVDAGISNFESVSISTSDGQILRGYLMWPHPLSPSLSSVGFSKTSEGEATSPLAAEAPGSANAKPPFVLLYFHGNAGNVGHRLFIAKLFLSTMGCAVLMVDYRGFGLSSSSAITQNGLEMDAQACLDFIRHDERLPQDKIYVMGTSLGAAVALHLAAKLRNARHISGVIIENTFTSISDMAVIFVSSLIRQFSIPFSNLAVLFFIYYVFPLMLHLKWRNLAILQGISVPMLFLSGLKDELVPPEQMRRLYKAACARNPKGDPLRRLVTFQEGSHNDMFLCYGYTQTIFDFVNDVEKGKTVNFIQ